jgi:hypothetical protein
MMAVEVRSMSGDAFEFGTPRVLFKTAVRSVPWLGYGTGTTFDVTPGGDRFLVNVVDKPAVPGPYIVLLNWTAAVRR